MLIYCAIDYYIHTGKPFGVVLNLTTCEYKIFNVAEGQMKYDLLANIIYLIGRLTHPQKKTSTEAFIITNNSKLKILTATYPWYCY